MNLPEKLDELVIAYENRGCDVNRLLQPGMTREEIIAITSVLPFYLPEDAYQLYSWRNGQHPSAEWDDYAESLRFRDNTFISLHRGLEGYKLINKYYETQDPLADWGVDLRNCLPFATFEQAWYVLVCGPHRLDVIEPHPVVVVYQDVGWHFHSIEKMVSTCIEWVNHPRWAGVNHLPEKDEKTIWRKYNPGIFNLAT